MKFLITGGLGFIGSHFVEKLFQFGHEIIVLDKLTYTSTIDNLDKEIYSSIEFHKVDIASKKDLSDSLDKHFGTFDWVINFAAESHVDKSVENGVPFCNSNVLGLVNILEFMKSNGGNKMIQISTDEVYGSIKNGSWNENTPLNPRNPYSASKASAEFFCNSYRITHGVPIITTRCTNNFGPKQSVEKFIPKIIYSILNGIKIPIYGTGNNRREWTYVSNHIEALYAICEKNTINHDNYNIGGYELANNDLAQMIIKKMDSDLSQIDYIVDRPGHDFRYALDDSRFKSEFQIKEISFDSGLDQTINWYLNNSSWLAKSAKRVGL